MATKIICFPETIYNPVNLFGGADTPQKVEFRNTTRLAATKRGRGRTQFNECWKVDPQIIRQRYAASKTEKYRGGCFCVLEWKVIFSTMWCVPLGVKINTKRFFSSELFFPVAWNNFSLGIIKIEIVEVHTSGILYIFQSEIFLNYSFKNNLRVINNRLFFEFTQN